MNVHRLTACAWISGLVILALGSLRLSSQERQSVDRARIEVALGQLPLYFIEDRGADPEGVSFAIRGAEKTLFFSREGITFRLKGKDKGWVVKLDFVGADPAVVPRGEDRQPAVFSYFIGPEKEWKTGLKTFARLVYENLWPGIDLVYRGTVNKLKYEFVVRPGADPSRIRLRYRGCRSLVLSEHGAIKVDTPAGGFEDAPPSAYQEIDGKRVAVEMAYVLFEDSRACQDFGFRIGDYDRSRALVLDPVILVYCGYVGGAVWDYGGGIAVDSAGNVYLAGSTQSGQNTFPVKVGPDLTYNDTRPDGDAFVAKVNAQGTALVYCGYIGGASRDWGSDIAVDDSGNAYVAGSTQSDERTFPVTMGPDLTYNGGRNEGDAFVAKVNPQGTGLVYCGYIGGAGDDRGYGIAVDSGGNAYVTGETLSDEKTFPVKVGPDLTYNTVSGIRGDAFVAKVHPQGSWLRYCGYIGGAGNDLGQRVTVDGAGNAYVTGTTQSDERTFPVKVGPDLTFNGGGVLGDAFVAKVDPQGTWLTYCGFIGGAGDDTGYAIAVDGVGSAYVTGTTDSDQSTFPVSVGPDLTHNGSHDAYVAKVNPQGTGLTYCGYVGGSGSDAGNGIALDGAGNAFVVGFASSDQTTFPAREGPALTHNGGYYDVFVARVSLQGTGLAFCGYIGGADYEVSCGIAVDSAGNGYVTGTTRSYGPAFPATVGPDLTHNGGGYDVFVAKVACTLLAGSGAPRPGNTYSLALNSSADSGLPFQLGSSLGTGPIPVDKRQLGLSPDDLLVVTVNNYWPAIFSGYRGVIGANGQAQAAIHIPNLTVLIGLRLHTAFVTLSAAAPSGIRSISNTLSFSITR